MSSYLFELVSKVRPNMAEWGDILNLGDGVDLATIDEFLMECRRGGEEGAERETIAPIHAECFMRAQ